MGTIIIGSDKLYYSFWHAHNMHVLKRAEQISQLAALKAAYAADSATLDKLERTNVYNDAVCIGHDGVFGTINGLRLGRVPGVPVCIALTAMSVVTRRANVTFRLNGLR